MVTVRRLYEIIDEAAVSAFESVSGVSLPRDYVEFLLEYNGGRPSPCGFFAAGWPLGMLCASQFFGLAKGKPGDLSRNREIYQDRIPNTFLAIGFDPGGNLICLGTAGGHRGQVYFWHHEDEPEDEDPRQPLYPNMYWIANTFPEFINFLKDA